MWNRFFFQSVKVPVDLIHATVFTAFADIQLFHDIMKIGLASWQLFDIVVLEQKGSLFHIRSFL